MKVRKIDLRDECTLLQKGDIVDCSYCFTVIFGEGKCNLSLYKSPDRLKYGTWCCGLKTFEFMEKLYKWESGE